MNHPGAPSLEEHLEIEELCADAYAPFGPLLWAAGKEAVDANQGRAQRSDYAGCLVNLRPNSAKLVLSVFETQGEAPGSFELSLLERHAYSTQVFSPMGNLPFVVVVAPAGESIDPSQMRCFRVPTGRAIGFHPGVWHHPLIAAAPGGSFLAMCYEDGTASDCEERAIATRQINL